MSDGDNAQTIQRLIVAYSIGYGIPTISTIIRLGHRWRRGKFWWDDFWALIALLLTVFTVGLALWSISSPDGESKFSVPTMVPGRLLPAGSFSPGAQAFLGWGIIFIQPAVVWSSRLSIQATVIYFLPQGRELNISKRAFAVLVLFWLATAISKLFYCGIPIPRIPVYPYAKGPTLVSLALNVISTAWLVAWPAFLVLTRIPLPKPQRRLFTVCFSTVSLLLAIEIFHTVNLIQSNKYLALSANIELMLSLMICNVLVLASYAYNAIKGLRIRDDDGLTETTTGSTSHRRNPRSHVYFAEFQTTRSAPEIGDRDHRDDGKEDAMSMGVLDIRRFGDSASMGDQSEFILTSESQMYSLHEQSDMNSSLGLDSGFDQKSKGMVD